MKISEIKNQKIICKKSTYGLNENNKSERLNKNSIGMIKSINEERINLEINRNEFSLSLKNFINCFLVNVNLLENIEA